MRKQRFLSLLIIYLYLHIIYANNINLFDFGGKLQTNSVTSILQDSQGFLWLGYDNGIARFDGYTVKPYSLNTDSLYIGYVNCLHLTEQDELYIGTNDGFYKYIPLTNKIEIFNSSLKGYEIISIKKINQEWYVASNHGLFIFDKNQTLIRHLDHTSGLSNKRVNCIELDQENNLWIGTETGLDRLSIYDSDFRIIPMSGGYRTASLFFDRNDLLWFCRNEDVWIADRKEMIEKGESVLKRIAENAETISSFQRRNEVWIGTRGRGILRYSILLDQAPILKEHIWIEPENVNEIKNTVLSFCEDIYSNIWIGTLDGLYLYIRERSTPFHWLKYNQHDLNTPSHTIISSIYCDADNHLWMATANGVNKFSWAEGKKQYKIERYYDNRDASNQLGSNKIQTIVEYRKGILLVSTKSDVKFFDASQKCFYEDKQINDTLNYYGMKYVRSSYKDNQGNIWLAFSEGGLGVIDVKDGILYKLHIADYINSRHRSIMRDRSGDIWVSSDDKGLYRISLGKHISEVKQIKNYGKQEFDNHTITALYIDKSNKVWVGTLNGLYYYEAQINKFLLYEFPYSRKDIYVSGIIEDFYNNIWVTSIRGVYRISDKIETQYYEPHSVGDIAKTWYIFGLAIDKDGVIMMGGVNGLIYFNPTDVIPDSYSQSPCISELLLLNKPLLPDGKHLDREINQADKLVLTYKDYQFSLEFSALYFPEPMKIKYAYKLEGFDKEWIYTDAYRRYASYTNLPAGDYTFKVKSTSTSGIWLDNIKEISILILPSPWQTWWAYLIYTIILIGIFLLIYRVMYLTTQVKYKEEFNQWKMKYYINLVYSFKTPLTLLYAPLQTLLKEYDHLSGKQVKELFSIMQRNANKLSFLISQLMECRKIDLGKNTLSVSETDIIHLTENIYNSFCKVAESRNIDYQFESNISSVSVYIDPEKIEVALFNLISNAFKYTSPGGKIVVKCQFNSLEYKLCISVIDTGTGIPKELQKKIFERFWRSEKEASGEEQLANAGIGLSLARDFIHLHHSEITLESEPDKGSNFSFYILLGNTHFTPEEIKEKKIEAEKNTIVSQTFMEMASEFEKVISDQYNDKEVPLICLHTSDHDMLRLMKNSLNKEYQVEEFKEVNELKEYLRKSVPLIILIDLSFEKQDGMILCSRIREDKQLSGFPLILLSAMETEEEKRKGYEAGADAYITKPFDLSYLRMRMEQLIQSRLQIKEKIKQELIVNPKEINITSDDDLFLANVVNTIEEHINDENFNVDELADKLRISRSMLYRRINLLTNHPPIELIKSIRLKRAAQYLESTSYNVSEISTMVGFADQRYFSACFKKYFGITPKAYSMKNRNKENK